MIAARNGDLGMLQALLSRGADSSARDSQGRTVFEWAEPSSSTAKYVVAFLLDRGISKEAPRRGVPAQSPQVNASLRTLAAVLARVPPASTALRTAQRRANAVLSQLQALSVKWPADSPDDYRDNLAGYVDGARSRAEGRRRRDADRDGSVRRRRSRGQARTLHAERRQARWIGRSFACGRCREATESKSWQVFYMPRIFEAAGNASPDLFPQLSSPTEETLVPGRYVMWVRDPATARLGERTVVKVGEGRKELLLDLPVPRPLPNAMTSGARLLGRHRRVWLAVAAVLLAGIAAALTPPPPAIASAGIGASSFAALASAAIVTLAILPFLVWRGAARPTIWVVTAVAALALGMGSFSVGGYAQRACTARYAEQAGHHRHGTDDARRGLQAGKPGALERRSPVRCRRGARSDMDPTLDRPLQCLHRQHLFPLDSVSRRLSGGHRSGRPDDDPGAGPAGTRPRCRRNRGAPSTGYATTSS